jgi:3-phenylpropionate/trans-cinnamate dioxygenase ferredoxin reductase subunit
VSGGGGAKPRWVIVGGGHAAAQLCASLIPSGPAGRVTVIGDEPTAPYHRPPLSKTQLDPQKDAAAQLIRPEAFYADHGITLRRGEAVRSINRQDQTVTVGAERLAYDALVLATGSLHRRPPIRGIAHPKVFSLRTAAEAAAIRAELPCARRAAVIGGGFIGLEVASSLRTQGLAVSVYEMADRVLSRVTCPAVSSFFEAMHRRHGVDLQTGVAISSIEEEGGRLRLRSQDEAVDAAADFVVLGAGAQANDALARQAGLEVSHGIVVDAEQRTSDPSIFAMGDCCSQVHPLYGASLRLESVQNANDQAKAVAAALMGQPVPTPPVPWFWSDQYDTKLQIAGVSAGHDTHVVRGDPGGEASFSVWYLKAGRLLAVDAVNDPRAYIVGGKLIHARAQPDPESLADLSLDLKTLLT